MLTRLVPALVFLCLLIGLGGCDASGPRFREVPLDSGQATIYAYRHTGYGGSAVTLDISIDQKPVGGLKPGGYVYGVVTPGKHMVTCSTESESAVEIDARAGQSYYIEGEVVMGFWVGRPKLTMVAADIGRANIGGKNYCGNLPQVPVTGPAK